MVSMVSVPSDIDGNAILSSLGVVLVRDENGSAL